MAITSISFTSISNIVIISLLDRYSLVIVTLILAFVSWRYVKVCDASKWRLGTTAIVPGLPPLARDSVVPARHSLCVLSSTRAPLRNPNSGSC